MILYQYCCLSARCISPAALSPSSSVALVFFTLLLQFSFPPFYLPPFLSSFPVLPTPSFGTLFPPLSLSLPSSQLWIWRYTWSRGRVGFKRKGVSETAFFSPLFSSYLELPSGVPRVRFLPAAETKPLSALGLGSPGSTGAF